MKNSDLNGQLHEANPNLHDVVSHFYQVYNPAGAEPVLKHLSPSLEMLLILNFGPEVPVSFNDEKALKAIERMAVIGPLRRMFNYELPPGANAIVVNFQLNGFYRLFKTSLNDLSGNEIHDPVTLFGDSYLEELWKELAPLNNIVERLQILGDFLTSLLEDNDDEVIPLIEGEAYFHNPVIQPVKAIAADAHLTERTIQLRFKKYAGYSPKELMRFLRFKAVLAHLMRQPAHTIDIFDLIGTYNYHDQSHLIKDFNHFLGTTPMQFIKKLKNEQFYVTGQDKLGTD